MGNACTAPKESKARESAESAGDFKFQHEQPTDGLVGERMGMLETAEGAGEAGDAAELDKMEMQAKIQEAAEEILRMARQDKEDATRLLKQVEQSRGDAVRKHTAHQAKSSAFDKLRSTAADQLRVATLLDQSSRRLLQQSEGLLAASHQAATRSSDFLGQARAAQGLAGAADQLDASIQRQTGKADGTPKSEARRPQQERAQVGGAKVGGAQVGGAHVGGAQVGAGEVPSTVGMWDQLGVKGKELLGFATEGEAAALGAGKQPEVDASRSEAGDDEAPLEAAEVAAFEAGEALVHQDQREAQDTGDVVSQAATKARESAKQAEEDARKAKMWQEAVTNFQKFHNANQKAAAVKQEIRSLLDKIRGADEKVSNDMEKYALQLVQLRELMDKLPPYRQGAERAEADVERKARDIAPGQVGTPVAGPGAAAGAKDIAVWLAGFHGVPTEVAARSLCRCFSSAVPSHMLCEASLAGDRGDSARLRLADFDFHPADALLFTVWARSEESGSGGGRGPAPERFVGAASLHGGALPASGTHTANLPVCGGEHAGAFLSLRFEVLPSAGPATATGSWLGGSG